MRSTNPQEIGGKYQTGISLSLSKIEFLRIDGAVHSRRIDPIKRSTYRNTSTWRVLLEDVELMPQYQDFGFQQPSRLEAVAQHADEKEGNCDHPTIMF